jgi:hypothetical protein
MSFTDVMAELPALSVEERQMLVRRALEIDEAPLLPVDEAEIERRRVLHSQDPGSALSLDAMQARIRSRIGA